VLSFWRPHQSLILSEKLTSPVKLKVFGACEEFNDTPPLAEFIRNSWKVPYDERIAAGVSSDKPLGDTMKRFSGMPYEFVKARICFLKQAQSAAEHVLLVRALAG
jgi:hypothetical protein